jgi:Undecaprenyl-phosphate glucose phosphotransferase
MPDETIARNRLSPRRAISFTRMGWCWPIPYNSVGPTVCALDIALIITASVVTGTIYSHVFHESTVDLVRYASTAIVVSAIFVPIFRYRNLYDPGSLVNWGLQIRNIVILWTVTLLVFAGSLFALKVSADFSRGAVLSFGFGGLVALVAHHALWRVVIRSGIQNGSFRGRTSILLCIYELSGGASTIQEHVRDLKRHGYEIEQLFYLRNGDTLLALIDRVIAAARGSEIEEIFVAADLQRWTEIRDLIQRLRDLPLPLTLLPNDTIAPLFQRTSRRLGSSVAVEFQRAPLGIYQMFSKRLLDLAVSIAGIVLLLPMFLIVALAIKADSRGPALFMQTRYGFNSKKFKIIKFRTMTVLEDGKTVVQAMRNDKRVTRLGAWLRKTSIDELPQLFNVLSGEMSIVGPRPHAMIHDDHFAQLIGHYGYRHHMKPGITGWAQVHGCRGETPTLQSMKERIDFDIWYADNWGLLLDVKIILRTVSELLRGRNAY